MNEFDQHPQISSLLDEAIAAGDFPSAVYAVAEEGRVRFADARGFAVHDESGKIQLQPATLETIYDLASLTKPLVTGLLCARRAEGGQ
nr:serine hydrolase [Pyrinomonadaceae bacterium]